MLSRIEETNILVAEKIMDGKEGNYAEDISLAWLVVEKFPNVAIFGPNDSWLVRFSDEDGSIYTHPIDEPARADTAPLAICLGALKAVGVT